MDSFIKLILLNFTDMKMLEAVNDYSIPIDTVLEEYFDEENITYWMGFQILMGNVDTQN